MEKLLHEITETLNKIIYSADTENVSMAEDTWSSVTYLKLKELQKAIGKYRQQDKNASESLETPNKAISDEGKTTICDYCPAYAEICRNCADSVVY